MRVFRRAQAVQEVVKGPRLHHVSDPLHLTSAAFRTWVDRCATQGIQGVVDRPRPGRPAHVTCALAQPLNRLGDHAPLEDGSLSSPWSCRALATALAPPPGGQLGRESVRGV